MDTNLLRIDGVSKHFGGVTALSKVSLGVRVGEVHALVGENGAGKSTLLKIVAGLMSPDTGEMWFRGKRQVFRSPREAIAGGISMIHQELMSFPELTVMENVFMGREPQGSILGSIARKRMQVEMEALMARIGIVVAPNRRMGTLSVAEAQLVEIAKAVSQNVSLMIMDEPTSSLSHCEAEALFGLVGNLRRRGVAIIYVSHKLDEIFLLADRVSVMRDGRRIVTESVNNLDESTLVRQMIGRPVDATKRRNSCIRTTQVLRVQNFGRIGQFYGINFTLHAGEILGFAGLIGAGRTAMVSALYGLAAADRGTIWIENKPVHIARPCDGQRHGIGFVSEDRKRTGLVLNASVKHNLTLGYLPSCSRYGAIRKSFENDLTDRLIRTYGIKTASRDLRVQFLSGGNQQKVMIAKATLPEPKILILDEPTRGVDIGAKEEIYAMIVGLACRGCGILLVSSELSELLALSDRIVVMRQGAIAAELEGGRCSQADILRYAMPN